MGFCLLLEKCSPVHVKSDLRRERRQRSGPRRCPRGAGRPWPPGGSAVDPAAGRGRKGQPRPAPGAGSRAPQAAQSRRRGHASPRQRGVCSRPDWPGAARAGAAGRARRRRRRSAGLNLAGPMWAAGRWGAAWALSDARLPADGTPGSRPSSGTFSVLTADDRGPGPKAVAAWSPSPPVSCSNSTRSLLSPLHHQSFRVDDADADGEDEGEVSEDALDSAAPGPSPEGVQSPACAR